MTALTISPSVEVLAWTLVHFLWQGAALGVIVFLWLRLGRPSAQARYVGGVLALAALLAAPVATFLWLGTAPYLPVSSGLVPLSDAPAPTIDLATRTPAPGSRADAPDVELTAREVAAATVVVGWAAGVLLLSLRLAGGWILVQRLAAGAARPTSAEVSALAAGVSARLGLTRTVRVIESAAVAVPMVVGWMKPVVLLPASALSGLSPEQIEALIAHELAHVRRHDYILNVLQSMVETLLFYHPAVWFVSRQVRQAREECCDDLAVGVCDRVVYVRALADLAGLAQAPRIALAATDGYLLRRVQRLLGQPQPDRGPGAAWLGILSMALVVGGVMPTALGSSGNEPIDAPQAAVGGVAGGQAEGVVGGVADGVAGGGHGGVAGGIAGGLDGVPQPAVDEREAVQRRSNEELRRARRADENYRALAQRLAEIERLIMAARVRQSPTDRQPAQGGASTAAQLEARAARARAELHDARLDLQSSQLLFEKNLVSASHMREVEAQVAAAERELSAIAIEIQATAEEAAARDQIDFRRAQMQAELQVRHAELDLATAQRAYETNRTRAEVGLVRPEAVAETRTAVVSAEQRLEAARLELQLAHQESQLRQQRTRALHQLARELEASGVRYALHADGPLANIPPAADPGARAQPGDVLAIEIAGESNLPRTYPVDAKGAIRLPLVGSIQVTGLTAAEVRDAVIARLGQRQLAEGKQVSVTLHRQK